MVLVFQYVKLFPLNIGGMIDPIPSWLLILRDLPSSDQAPSEGLALIPIIRKILKRGVNQYLNFQNNNFFFKLYTLLQRYQTTYVRDYNEWNQRIYNKLVKLLFYC